RVCNGIIGSQCECMAKFPFCRSQVPVVAHGHFAEDSVSVSELGIELQGPLAGFLRFRFSIARGQPVIGYLAENGGRRSQASVSLRVIWIVVYRLLKKDDAAAQVTAAAPGKFTLKEGVTGVDNLRRRGVNGSRLHKRLR